MRFRQYRYLIYEVPIRAEHKVLKTTTLQSITRKNHGEQLTDG
jgi:hypothetical protein